MVWPLARSKGGSNSSVAALIAVEMKALISAAWAVAVAASMAMMIAIMRMTFQPRTQLPIARYRIHARRPGGLGASLQPAAIGRQPPLPLTVGSATCHLAWGAQTR